MTAGNNPSQLTPSESEQPIMTELVSNIAEYDPSKLATSVLLVDFRIVLAWYSIKQSGGTIRYSQEEIENTLQLIMQELLKRGNTEFHPDTMKPIAREAFEKVMDRIKTGGIMGGLIEKQLEQIPDFVKHVRDATIIKDAVSLIGSSVEHNAYHDIDVLIRISNPTDFIKRAVETRINKMFPDEVSDKLHFVWGDPEGPHDSFVPLFDLVLVAQKPRIIQMSTMEPLRSFVPMKPAHRFYESLEAVDYAFSKAKIWACEKKYNGFRAVIHKKGNEIKIFSDQSQDITFPFPTVESQAKAASVKDFIIDCEMVPYSGNTALGRNVAAQYIGAVKSHKDIDDSQIVFFVFDCLYLDGDISNEPWSVRKKTLNGLHFANNLRNSPAVITDSKDEAYKAIRMFANMVGSEGSIMKDYEAPYLTGKETDAWIKYRTLLPLRATVLKVNQVAGDTKARNYETGIRISLKDLKKINPEHIVEFQGGNYMNTGNTFNTSVAAQPGDTLDLLIEEIWRHKHKDGTIHYSFHKPNVKGISSTTRNSTLDELDAFVVSRGVEVEAQATTTADIGGSSIDARALQPITIAKKKKKLLELQAEGEEPEDKEGAAPNNFPDQMQEDFKKVMLNGKLLDYVLQWHYRGHEITPEERSKDSIPEKYKYKMKSLHLDSRYAVNDHLQGITMLTPTSTEASDSDQVGKETKNVRAVLKVPQPKGWLDVQGIAEPGKPGTTRKAPAVFVIVGKGKYKPVIVEDHRIIMEMHPAIGKINEAVFSQAEKAGILIERKPDANYKQLPKYLNYHIAHIGDHHILLVDGQNGYTN